MAGKHRLLKCLLLLLLIYTRAAGAVMIGGCRTAAECATAGGGVVIGEEFAMLMDSETNKRLLERATNNLNIYDSLHPGPICDAKSYGDCIGKAQNRMIKCGNYTRDCSGGG
nr:RALF-LIKE 27 family protein [Ipomoea batatas]